MSEYAHPLRKKTQRYQTLRDSLVEILREADEPIGTKRLLDLWLIEQENTTKKGNPRKRPKHSPGVTQLSGLMKSDGRFKNLCPARIGGVSTGAKAQWVLRDDRAVLK